MNSSGKELHSSFSEEVTARADMKTPEDIATISESCRSNPERFRGFVGGGPTLHLDAVWRIQSIMSVFSIMLLG